MQSCLEFRGDLCIAIPIYLGIFLAPAAWRHLQANPTVSVADVGGEWKKENYFVDDIFDRCAIKMTKHPHWNHHLQTAKSFKTTDQFKQNLIQPKPVMVNPYQQTT